jgi:DNA-binding GntR family transcriptional regulator
MTQSAARRATRVAAPLRRQVGEWLREDIVSGQFAPGERLVERDLCQRYEVSRTVVREALRQLEASGLVTTVANKGPEVARVTRADVVAVYEVRAVLEGLAGRLFAERAGDEDKVRLVQSVDDVAAAMSGGDIRDVLASKDAFYANLFAGAANPVITGTLRTLHARIQMMRGLSLSAPGRSEQTLQELRGIVAMIQAGDGPGAARACEEHVKAAAAVVLATLDARAQEQASGEGDV